MPVQALLRDEQLLALMCRLCVKPKLQVRKYQEATTDASVKVWRKKNSDIELPQSVFVAVLQMNSN